jgi:hypothetical protein
VVSADDTAITVDLAERSASSWEDMFKEQIDHADKTLRRVTIEVVGMKDGKPKLRYAGADFSFRTLSKSV